MQLEFKVIYYYVAIQNISHYARGTLPSQIWLENYLNCLPEKDAQKVHETETKSISTIKSVNRNNIKSFEKVLMSTNTGEVPITIETELVAVNISFLLSKDSIVAA